MTRRPLPIWCRYMHKEDPPKADRRKLISEHQKGGCKFEEGVVTDMMGDAKIKQGPNWDVKTGQELWWIYIGKFWWCRKNKKRYEFARLYAIKYEDDTKFIDGLWNEVRHGDKQQPKIVYKDKKKGYVVGHNKFEILVQWEDDYMRRSVQKPYSSLGGISFEFEEDEQYFKKLLNKKEKQDGESPSTTSNSKEEDCTAQ